MSEWINCDDRYPSSYWEYVLVTDGKLVYLANWIGDPKDWYGKDLLEWNKELQEEVLLDKEWHDPHWTFDIAECGIGPFIEGQSCFGEMEGITHWMPLPTPPQEDKEPYCNFCGSPDNGKKCARSYICDNPPQE